MSMYSRSIWERSKIQAEIMFETCTDSISNLSDTAKKPLFLFVGTAMFFAVRSARNGVSMTSAFGYSPWKKAPVYGAHQPQYGSRSQYGRSTSQYGAGASQYGAGAAVASAASQYGAGATAASQYGAAPPRYGAATPQYGAPNNLRGTATSSYGNVAQSASAGVNTASLVDTHGASVQVVQGGQFKDYGMVTNFMGQIETVSAMDAPAFVQQVLQSPGNGRILIIDSGGSLNAAVLDSAAVNLARQNGWKGIIVNGAIRNADAMKTAQIGVKALGTHPSKGQQAGGQTGAAVSFGGVNFSRGNWVYSDKDGIVVSQVSLGGGSSNSITPVVQQQQYTGAATTAYGGAAAATNAYGGAATNAYGGAATNAYGGAAAATNAYGGAAPNTYGGAATNAYGGAATTAYTRPNTYGAQTQSGYSAGRYGATSKFSTGTTGRTSKRKMISMLLILCAIVWICLGD